MERVLCDGRFVLSVVTWEVCVECYVMGGV